MKIRFLIKFGKLFDFEAPSYDDRQISELLSDAQVRVILHRYNPLGNKYKKGFEANEQRRRDLDQLIKPALYTQAGTEYAGIELIEKPINQNGVHPNGVFLEMPDDYLWSIEEAALVDDSTKEIKVVPITHDEYTANKDNPFEEPESDELLWRMDIARYQQAEGTDTEASAKRVEIILPSSSTLNQYRTRYISIPPNIVVDATTPNNQRHCILDKIVHNAIVDEAVAIADGSSKQEEYQVSLNEGLKSE